MAGEPTYRDLLRAYARKYKVPEDLAFAVIAQESGGKHERPDGLTTSSKGAQGFMQLLPQTAFGEFGLDSRDPAQNLEAGVRYLRKGMEATGGNTYKTLEYYHGGPNTQIHGPLTRMYADTIMKKLQALPPSADAAPSLGGPRPRPGHPEDYTMPRDPKATIREPTWREQHPFLANYNPMYPEGRRNFGSAGGSIVGGGIGAVVGGAGAAAESAGTATGPGAVWGAKAGSAIGAGLGGGLVQAIEETGIFPNAPPKPPGTTPFDRIVRTGLEEGGWDIAGQAITAPVRGFFRSALQGKVAKYAKEYFDEANQDVLQPLYTALGTLRSAVRNLTLDRDAVKTAEQQAARDASRRAGTAAEAYVSDVKAAEGAKVRGIVQDTRATVGGLQDAERAAAEARRDAGLSATERRLRAQETGQAGVTAAEKLAADRLAGTETEMAARGTEKATGWRSWVGLPPSEAVAGRAAAEVIEGPATVARRALGEAVDAAAATGDDVNLATLKNELRGIVQRELLPPASNFPRIIPPGAGGAPSQDALALGLQGVTDAQWAELQKDPVMGIIARVLNSPDVAKFSDVHSWKKQLGAALDASGAFDRPKNPVLTNITEKIVGGLRTVLREGKNTAYEQATKAYEEVAPLFSKGYADLIKRTAIDAPERLVQTISPDDPTSTRMVVKLLTEMSEQGGDKQLGETALAKVQEGWIYRNLYSGDLTKLGERLAKLKTSPNWPDFQDAFLKDGYGKGALQAAEELSGEIEKEFRYQAARIAAAKAGGAEGVERASVAAKTAKDMARAVSLEELRAARAAVKNASAATRAAKQAKLAELEAARAARTEAVSIARREGGRAVEAVTEQGRRAVKQVSRETREQLAGKAAEKQRLQEEIRLARRPSAAQQAFRSSTLSPGAMRAASQATRDRIIQAIRAGVIGLGGYKALGPFGAAVGVLGLGAMRSGASEADMMRYAFASPFRTRLLVHALATSRVPLPSAAAASLGKAAYDWGTEEPPVMPDADWQNMEQLR